MKPLKTGTQGKGMKKSKFVRGYAAFTLIELVVVMVVVAAVTVVAYQPLRNAVNNLVVNRKCQAVRSQFTVVFDRVKTELSQAGTILNVQDGPRGDGVEKWLTYQSLNGNLRLLYYTPPGTASFSLSAGVSIPGKISFYEFTSDGSDPNGVIDHNNFIAANTPPAVPPLHADAKMLANNLEEFGLELFAVSDTASSAATLTSSIHTASYLRVQAKPRSDQCIGMPPMEAMFDLRNRGRQADHLVFSEIMYETVNADFVEITNPLSISVNLDNFTLEYRDISGSTPVTGTFSGSISLAPGERIIVASPTAAGNIDILKRRYPVVMQTETPYTIIGSFPTDIASAGSFRLTDNISATGGSGCPELTNCEDYVSYGTHIQEDFNWGDESVATGAYTTGHGWTLSGSPNLVASGDTGWAHRRIRETLSGTGTQLYSQSIFLPGYDGDGSDEGGVMATFEVSGARELDGDWYLENSQLLTLDNAATVHLSYDSLRQFDLNNSGTGNRALAFEYCKQGDACWGDHAGAGWTALGANGITDANTGEAPAPLTQEMRASSYENRTASVALLAGTYKFRIRHRIHDQYAQ